MLVVKLISSANPNWMVLYSGLMVVAWMVDFSGHCFSWFILKRRYESCFKSDASGILLT